MRIGPCFYEEGSLYGLLATVEVVGIATPVQHKIVGKGLAWHK